MRAGMFGALLAAAMAAGAGGMPLPASAQEASQPAVATGRLGALLGLPGLFEVMAEEGRASGLDLEAGLFPGRGGAAWGEALARVYDPAALQARFDTAFAAALQDNPETIAAAEAFFASDLGARITGLELAARRTLLDPQAQEAADVRVAKMQATRDPRLKLIRRLIEAGDLVEQNLAGTMTGRLAFATGLEGTAPPAQRRPMAELMADLNAEAPQIRADGAAWLIGFMVLAYAPLSEAELAEYVDFSDSPEGRALNAALFAGFDAAFTPVMQDLGREAGLAMRGQEI